ncbi:hypothetical protein [Jejuia spongiicola]|uniref:Uncharacterized protein n=1 Tax=Jejuia spongiicola TaxID=2942207 RepID=A0ABT0QE14_9FLAO|nr:hypothetical protein [Jejuia spongiicola]MCL6294713.1 hypothetical protein [Jejuia spongiicola]
MKIDSILGLEIQELKDNGIDEIGYYKQTSINYGVYSTAYLFWRKNKSTFIQKFEDSEYDKSSIKKFKSIEVDDPIFFNFYRLHKDKLNKEDVEHFKSNPDSIVGNTIYSSRVTTSHSSFSNFVIKTNNENFHKYFDHFDLKEFNKKKVYASKRKYTEEEKKKWRERDWEIGEYRIVEENFPIRNINYQHNQKLKIVEWESVISEFIENLESTITFERLGDN